MTDKMKTAESMEGQHKEISISEFFEKNRHLLGYDNKIKALLTIVREGVDNALDATEKSGGTLSVSARREGDNFVIEVSDNGPGIPKDVLSQIFDPFFTTKPDGKGTGLGLSICYGIIKKMGGEITVESAVGEGATFLISLPLKADA